MMALRVLSCEHSVNKIDFFSLPLSHSGVGARHAAPNRCCEYTKVERRILAIAQIKHVGLSDGSRTLTAFLYEKKVRR